MKRIDIKESGCVNPYHPPECPRSSVECWRDLAGHVVITEKEFQLHTDIVYRQRMANRPERCPHGHHSTDCMNCSKDH